MPLRNPWPWFVAVALVGLFAVPAGAQPPSPLELVRGLRESGQVDLALEYLKDLEKQPLAPDDKAAITLERAKCLLEASEDEPDEGTRQGMVLEAKEGLSAFLLNSPNHPRAVEALLATAKLTALDAKEQLNRARRMDIPPQGETPQENAEREAAMNKQKEAAKEARPKFLQASKKYAEAAEILRTRLEDKGLELNLRRGLTREAFEAELASAINRFNIAETYMPDAVLGGGEKAERNKFLEEAKELFIKLGKGPSNNRTVWVARAWAAEVTFEMNDFNAAAAEVLFILRAGVLEAEDGKRLARFFQLRRNFIDALGSKSLPKVTASVAELRNWLNVFGNPRKPTPEVFAVRYFLARALQLLADTGTAAAKGKEPPAAARAQYAEAERIYRTLAQSDHDYTSRSARARMVVVRRLLGEADQPVSTYVTFEQSQMASLIQMSKLGAAEGKEAALLGDPKTKDDMTKLDPVRAEIKSRRLAAIALLERSRELATPADNVADVTDVLLRLIYFYHQADLPLQAAVLGEHVAHTIKGTGGKAALAGLLGINGYVIASQRVKGDQPELVAAARQADRDRAMELARFLDEKFPNDKATDDARYRLGSMLVEEKRYPEAFEILTHVRPAYASVTNVRLLEGFVAQQIVIAKAEEGKPPPLPDAKKAEVFKRAVADLARVPKPLAAATEDEVRSYLNARNRLAMLMFLQGRADPAAEKTDPGYNQALTIAEQVTGVIPTYDAMVKKPGTKELNLDGLEMTMIAQDIAARALYLRARAIIDVADKLVTAPEKAAKYEEAAKAIEPTLEAVRTTGTVVTPDMKDWGTGAGEDGQQKAKIFELAGKVDKTRVDVILAGFRLKVKQGKAAESAAMLDLMLKAGGTIEDNLPVLEQLGRELAGQMALLKREGKTKDAADLGAGLAELLKKITAVKNLTPRLLLFLGQTLQSVGENDKAVETLKKVPVPEFAGWDKKKPEEIPAELRGRVQGQIRDYALAQVSVARALRESKKFADAEVLLTGIIGTTEKPGWGYGRLYFRKELAYVYEERGAATPNEKAAAAEWAKARQQWEQLFGIYRGRRQTPPKDATPEQLRQYLNDFAESYYDLQRYQLKVYHQLIKNPAQIQTNYETVAKRLLDIEKQVPKGDWFPEVQHKYADLLKDKDWPQVLPLYKNGGGKLFLEKLPNP